MILCNSHITIDSIFQSVKSGETTVSVVRKYTINYGAAEDRINVRVCKKCNDIVCEHGFTKGVAHCSHGLTVRHE